MNKKFAIAAKYWQIRILLGVIPLMMLAACNTSTNTASSGKGSASPAGSTPSPQASPETSLRRGAPAPLSAPESNSVPAPVSRAVPNPVPVSETAPKLITSSARQELEAAHQQIEAIRQQNQAIRQQQQSEAIRQQYKTSNLPVLRPEEQKDANTEAYNRIYDNPFEGVSISPLSTFSIDVDTASYTNVRRFIKEGQLPPKDAVRIEELINYFTYDYPQPTDDRPFPSLRKSPQHPGIPSTN